MVRDDGKNYSCYVPEADENRVDKRRIVIQGWISRDFKGF